MSRRGWVLFALMSVLWGIPYLLIKVAVEEVSPPVVVFARTAVGAAVLMPLAVYAGVLDVLRRHWKPLALVALSEIMVPWLLLTDAERYVSSSMAGLLVAAAPIIAVVVGKIAGDRERLGPLRLAGLLVGFAGVALLAAPYLTGEGFWPIVELFIVAIGFATSPLLAARNLAHVPSLPMTAACLSLTALVYTPPAILTWPDAMPSVQALAAIGGLALICTALAFLVFFELIREVGPARTTVFTYVNPAVAVAAGVVFLGESLTPAIMAGFALILGGSVLATTRAPAAAPATAGTRPSATVGGTPT